MTLNIIVRNIFPENLIEFPQVVQKIWKLFPSILAIYSDLHQFLGDNLLRGALSIKLHNSKLRDASWGHMNTWNSQISHITMPMVTKLDHLQKTYERFRPLRIERSASVCFFNIAIFLISFSNAKWIWISLESYIYIYIYKTYFDYFPGRLKN